MRGAEIQFPGRGDRQRATPADVGMSAERLAAAVAWAERNEIAWPNDVARVLARNERPPYNEVLGPTKPRGPAGGVVLRRGWRVAEWGDAERVDMTFSATKSYLSVLAGVACDRGLIRDPRDRVVETVRDGGFDGEHNGPITWEHLLQQTSEWQGTLFGLPDSVDHHRSVGRRGGPEKGTPRSLAEPGAYWEYNDVRVNRLALALLRVFDEPLPDVLRREVMDPIGASRTWEWHGYRNSSVDHGGRRLQSVPGGAHWGGGLWISASDHARVGHLLLARGVWDGKRILSEDWIDRATTPCPIQPGYGYLFWLNTGRRTFPAASERAFAARGAGGNDVVVEPEHDLVVVTRWSADPPGVVERVIEAIDVS